MPQSEGTGRGKSLRCACGQTILRGRGSQMSRLEGLGWHARNDAGELKLQRRCSGCDREHILAAGDFADKPA